MTHLEVLCDFTHQPLEGQLPDQQLGGLLVATDFTKGDRSWTETVGLLHTAGCGRLGAQIRANSDERPSHSDDSL